MNGDYLALAERLRVTVVDLQRVVERAETMRRKAVASDEEGFWDAVALNLHSFYAGVEQAFEGIAAVMDRSVPKGPNWHQDLLLQMSAPLGKVRPAVIVRKTRACLDEYREFRHVVRNIYPFNLRPARLQELMEGLGTCLKGVSADLSAFAAFLENTGLADEDPAPSPH